ncbi:MAG: UPF0175 family protein [Fimbriimonadales bacterium]|nr:UPF0175 family protein [Fimbriimonadales bacterium]
MPTLQIEIPEEVQHSLRLPPDEAERELRKELALALYARGLLPLGKARLLAQISTREFIQLLHERQIPRHYTEADLSEDLRYAHGS